MIKIINNIKSGGYWVWSLYLAILLLLVFLSSVKTKIPTPETYTNTGGFAWSFPTEIYGDNMENTKLSSVFVFENGRPLGPAHSLHVDIQNQGKGLFSHWRNTIYFSATDNSNPNSNGKTYKFYHNKQYVPKMFILYYIAFSGILILILSAVNTKRGKQLLSKTSVFFFVLFILVSIFATVQQNWSGHSEPIKRVVQGYHYVKSGVYLSELDEASFTKRREESVRAFTDRITNTVYNHTYHCEYEDFKVSIMAQIVAYSYQFGESPWVEGNMLRDRYRCGLCGSRAYLTTKILNDNGIEATPLSLNGHVVTLVNNDDKQYISDPDYGTKVFDYYPNDQLAETVKSAYENINLPLPNSEINNLMSYFSTKDDNIKYDLNRLNQLRTNQGLVFRAVKGISFYLITVSLLMLIWLIVDISRFWRRRTKAVNTTD